MKNYSKSLIVVLLLINGIIASCSSDDSVNNIVDETEEVNEIDGNDSEDTSTNSRELHAAFAEFDTDETEIYLSSDGTQVIIETTGNPNHESVYWIESSSLYIAEPGVSITPSKIDNRDSSFDFTIKTSPTLANSSTSTSLGTIGVAVSGAAIYNDEEGNGALDEAAKSLDWSGGHIGPEVYHYHLEPKAFSNDDENLIGVLKDGFFIYGRKCNSTGTYPTDLDSSGGHTSTTQHTDEAEYHYHVINELYSTTGSYIVFAGPFMGDI